MKNTLENYVRLQKNPNFRDYGFVELSILGIDFLEIRVYSPAHGMSRSMLIGAHKLGSWINNNGENPFLDSDGHSVCKIYRAGETLHFYIYWLSVSDMTGQISGHLDAFDLTIYTILDEITFQKPMKKLVYMGNERRQCRLVLTPSAHEQIRRIAKDKLRKRALIKLLRNAFCWQDTEEVKVYSDWGHDLYFTDGRISGGICLSTTTRKNGRIENSYRIHT